MLRQGQPQWCVEWIFHMRLSMSGGFLKLDVLYVVVICICHARMFFIFSKLYHAITYMFYHLIWVMPLEYLSFQPGTTAKARTWPVEGQRCLI